MRLSELIASGEISPEELANATELLERVELVKKAIDSCKKNILFPLGTKEIQCYSFMDNAGEYEAWGKVNIDGYFTCSSNWGGNHEIGSCNLLDFKDVFLALDKEEFKDDLRKFLNQQIEQQKE